MYPKKSANELMDGHICKTLSVTKELLLQWYPYRKGIQLQILRVDRHTVMANLVYNAFMYLICDTPILQMKPECGISREATNEGICSQHIPPGKCEYCCTDQTTLTTYY